MAKNQWIIEDDVVQSQPEESYLSQAKRIGTATGLSALKGIESTLSFIPETLLGVKAPHPKPSEIIQEKAGLTPEYLEPRNVGERYAQRLAGFAPLAATGGLSALGRTAAATGVATGLGEIGLPEPIQDIAQLGTEIGLGLKSGKIPTIKAAQKAEDTLARAAVKPGTKVNAELITNTLNGIERELGTEVSEKYANKIKHVLQTVGENIIKGKIEPAVAIDLRKKLYKLGKELPTHVSSTYIEPLTKGINNFFSVYAAENPAFYNHLKARDKLTSLKHMNLYTTKMLDSLQLNKVPGGQFVTNIINYIGKESERFIRGIASNSAARKYYFNAVVSAAQDNPNLFVKNINKLTEIMPEIKENINPQVNGWIIED